jgi:predicted transcriptional regulator
MPNDRPGNSIAAIRREEAFKLRLAGKSYRDIGKAVGISHAQAERYVKQALKESAGRAAATADELRRLELHRLDELLAALWGQKAEPQVASTIIRLGERRAKLLGLDAPTQLEHMLDPGSVQTVLGFALGGALRLLGEIRQALVDGSLTVEMIDDGQGVYVAEFEQRTAAELNAGSEAA